MAEESDVERLCDLYRDFHEFHARAVPTRLASLAGGDPTERAGPASRLREIMAAPDAALFVADVGTGIAGFGEIYVRETEPARALVKRRYAHVQSMFVSSQDRHRGIGRAPLAECETWAQSMGVCEITLDIWELPDGPLRFYERHGYRTIRRSLTREL
jgi:GNAT superfamily N-acetyltransferase